MQIRPVFLLIFLPFCILIHCNRPQSVSELSKKNIINSDSERIIELNANWKFYPNEFCTGPDCRTMPVENASMLWKSDGTEADYGTYLYEMPAPDSWSGKMLTLRLFDVGSAYRLYINGNFKGETGVPSVDPDSFEPEILPALYHFQSREKILIAVQAAEYAHPRGGLRNPPLIGTTRTVTRERDKENFRVLTALGVVAGMGIYHFGLFLNRREDKASLAFSVFAFFISVRIITTDEVFLKILHDDISYRLQAILEYTSFILAGPAFVLFVSITFPYRYWKQVSGTYMLAGILCTFFILFTPVMIFADYLTVYQALTGAGALLSVFIWTLALIRRMPGAIPSMLGGIIICVSAFNDILFYRKISPVGPTFQFALLFFILAQSYILSRLFAQTYDGVRKLTGSLKLTNSALSRFVPVKLMELLGKKDITEVRLGDQVEQRITVMFTDIRSFTTLSETMTPFENFNFLNSYLNRMTPIVDSHNGFVDKYIGDAVMALFPDSPDHAVMAAIEMQKEIRLYNSHRASLGYQPISIGIGIHTGDIMLGIIGHRDRMEGTVISDTVNTASRIEDLTRKYGVMIIISNELLKQLKEPERFTTRTLGKVRIKGRQEAIWVHHVLNGYSKDIRDLYYETKSDFESAVKSALAGNFKEAMTQFESVLSVNPTDSAARFYIERLNSGTETD